jgi:hypothetical protein
MLLKLLSFIIESLQADELPITISRTAGNSGDDPIFYATGAGDGGDELGRGIAASGLEAFRAVKGRSDGLRLTVGHRPFNITFSQNN